MGHGQKTGIGELTGGTKTCEGTGWAPGENSPHLGAFTGVDLFRVPLPQLVLSLCGPPAGGNVEAIRPMEDEFFRVQPRRGQNTMPQQVRIILTPRQTQNCTK